MKVLYIGNYKDGTGWGNACIGNILAMDSVGIDVVPRAISFEQVDKDYPERIKQLEQKFCKKSDNLNCDAVIQHTLPHLYCYKKGYKNIGFFATESDSFEPSAWQYYANIMDEIWVPSEQNLEAAKKSGVKVPIKVVPHSLDISQYTDVQGAKIQEMQHFFTFGFIGEFVERKNLRDLVRAFHAEFDTRDPVNLFIKTSKTNVEAVQNFCTNIRRGLKIRDLYREEIIVEGMLNEQDYISVMNQIDCFVMPSRGEAFCIPALESMALGIPVVYTSGTGMDFCGELGAVDSKLEPCYGDMATLPDLGTSDTMWREINVNDLRKKMRMMYENRNSYTEQYKQTAKEYDHKQVGMKIKEILNDG